jgi:hypothetical protein
MDARTRLEQLKWKAQQLSEEKFNPNAWLIAKTLEEILEILEEQENQAEVWPDDRWTITTEETHVCLQDVLPYPPA